MVWFPNNQSHKPEGDGLVSEQQSHKPEGDGLVSEQQSHKVFKIQDG